MPPREVLARLLAPAIRQHNVLATAVNQAVNAVIIAQDYLLADRLRGNMWSEVQGDKTAEVR